MVKRPWYEIGMDQPRSSAAPVVILTGSSSGIGQAIALDLHRHGFRVYGFARRPGSGAGFVHRSVDVRDEAAVGAAVDAVVTAEGGVDVLVNAAGYTVVGAIEECTVAQAQALFDTNLFGMMRVTRAVLPAMRRQGRGRIINIGSVLGFLPGPFMGLYAATKHAVAGFTESLDHEVRSLGIRAVCIEPGFTRTEIGHNAQAAGEPIADYRPMACRAEAYIQESVRRGMEPEVVARRVREAIAAADPPLRVPAGRRDRLLSRLRRFAPAGLLDKRLRRSFRLDGPA